MYADHFYKWLKCIIEIPDQQKLHVHTYAHTHAHIDVIYLETKCWTTITLH